MQTEMRLANKAKDPVTGKELNFSSIALLPMLGKSYREYRGLIENVYIGDYLRPEFSQNIMILVNSSNQEEFNLLLENIQKMPSFMTHYTCSENTEMLVFKVPESYVEDYSLFLKGRYSKVSPRLKDLILGKRASGYNYDIFYLTESRRKFLEDNLDVSIPKGVELFDPPNLEEEIYNYK